LLDSDVLFGIFVAVIAWGVFLTFAFFKDGLALRTPVAALATLVFYIVLDGTAVGWFVVTGQLFPLLSEARG
jgi:hypothetical protein